MNWLDILLLLILFLSTLPAVRRGFSGEAIGLLAAGLGLVFGIWFYGLAGAFLLPYVSSPHIADFLGFFIVFCGFLILGALARLILQRFVRTAGMSWFDRLLGAAFGLARGVLLSIAVITALVAFAPATGADAVPAAVANSRISPYIVQASSVLVAIAPRELKDSFHNHYEQLKSFWQQKSLPAPKQQEL
jgi:membrane protein required for colicin V production